MAHKYLDDLGIKFEDTPEGWLQSDNRQEFWLKQREEYGFDERETWGLDYSLQLWLYERLSMYNEITEGKINKIYHTFEYKDEILTQQDCIDKILDNLKYVLTIDDCEDVILWGNKYTEVFELLSLCIGTLWW